MKTRGESQDRDALVRSALDCLGTLTGCVVTGMAESILAEICAKEFPDVPLAEMQATVKVARGLVLEGFVLAERARAVATVVYLHREAAKAA